MYPNQPPTQADTPPQTPVSLDYLNQIAPQATSTGRFTPKQRMVGGILLIAIVLTIILSLVVSATSSGNTALLEKLAARLQTTATIASNAQDTIQDSNLQSINVTLQLYLSNTNRTIVDPLKAMGINTAKLPSSIIASEAGTDITNRLTDAQLNAVFDNTYAVEMNYQLSTIITLMRQIYNNTNNKSLKTFLETAYTNLTPIQTQFANFNSATS